MSIRFFPFLFLEQTVKYNTVIPTNVYIQLNINKGMMSPNPMKGSLPAYFSYTKEINPANGFSIIFIYVANIN